VRIGIRVWLWILILGAVTISGVIVQQSNGDLGNWLVSTAVLVVAATTLESVARTPGRLVVERQDELQLSDLIFYVYPQPALAGDQQVPRDYLLQLHVAVSNVGRRKAVLSRLTIDWFITQSGKRIHLPEGVRGALNAHKWLQARATSNLTAGVPFPVAQQEGPPFTLEPDDVETLRFRMRRGVDWTDKWTLDRLREYAAQLSDPIAAVEGEFVYRRGNKVVVEDWTADLSVLQQELYVGLFRDLTQDFTVLPAVDQSEIPLE
jgi:hypothetical protein